MSKYIIGIDVSKNRLDAFCSYDRSERSFDNNESVLNNTCQICFRCDDSNTRSKNC